MRRSLLTRPLGQSMLEYTVLIGAVVAALVVMSDYVRKAYNAQGRLMQDQLNGATLDNTPGSNNSSSTGSTGGPGSITGKGERKGEAGDNDSRDWW